MKNLLLPMAASLFFLVLASACTPTGRPTEGPQLSETPQRAEVENEASLVSALRAAGAQVELGDAVEKPFFTVTGQILTVNGLDLQIFEYETAEAMEADAAQISPDGSSVGTSMVMWTAPPHFFKGGRLLVLYLGGDEAMLDLLSKTIGEQFAGAEVR